MAPTKGKKVLKSPDKVVVKANRKSPRSITVKEEEPTNDAMEEEINPELPIMASGKEISEYERARLENIRKNEMFLNELGLVSVKSSFTTATKFKTARKTTLKQAFKVVQSPTRRSGRVTVDKLVAEIAQLRQDNKIEEANTKQIELDAMIAKQKEGAYEPDVLGGVTYEEAYVRLSVDPLPMTQLVNEDDEEQRQSLSLALKNCLIEAGGSTVVATSSSVTVVSKKKGRTNKSSSSSNSTTDVAPFSPESSSKSFANLQLKAKDVVKMTPNRISSVALHPSSNKMIAAAGDKAGYLAIWDCDYTPSSEIDVNQGIYRYRPHVSNVCKMEFASAFDHQLLSTSYDGTIRCLDLNQDACMLKFQIPEELGTMYLTDSALLLDHPQSMLLSKSNGFLSLVDFRTATSASSNEGGVEFKYEWDYDVSDSKLSSVQVHPTENHLIITSSAKHGIAIRDIRRVGKKWDPITVLDGHTKSINASYVSPDGKYLVSVALDDTVLTWRNFTLPRTDYNYECHVLRHNNFTGRWLSTFRPAFDPKRANTMVLGSMNQPRRVEIYNVATKGDIYHLNLISNLDGEYLASVNSRNCFHPIVEAVLGSNSSGKVHLFR
jgi:WD40 repeat protein